MKSISEQLQKITHIIDDYTHRINRCALITDEDCQKNKTYRILRDIAIHEYNQLYYDYLKLMFGDNWRTIIQNTYDK